MVLRLFQLLRSHDCTSRQPLGLTLGFLQFLHHIAHQVGPWGDVVPVFVLFVIYDVFFLYFRTSDGS